MLEPAWIFHVLCTRKLSKTITPEFLEDLRNEIIAGNVLTIGSTKLGVLKLLSLFTFQQNFIRCRVEKWPSRDPTKKFSCNK